MIYQKWDCSLDGVISHIKGGFDRVNLLQQVEYGFDRLFGYNRQLSESFDYRNTVKSGSSSEQFEIQNQDFTGEEGTPFATPSYSFYSLFLLCDLCTQFGYTAVFTADVKKQSQLTLTELTGSVILKEYPWKNGLYKSVVLYFTWLSEF